MYINSLIYLIFFFQIKISNGLINIQNFQLPVCRNETTRLGYNMTQYFYTHLFYDNITLSTEEMNCIINTPSKLSNIINSCISQLTINNNTKEEKVCQGMVLDNNQNWVSACAPNMPCVEFNTYVINGKFNQLLNSCGIESKFRSLLLNTDLIKYSILGYDIILFYYIYINIYIYYDNVIECNVL